MNPKWFDAEVGIDIGRVASASASAGASTDAYKIVDAGVDKIAVTS